MHAGVSIFESPNYSVGINILNIVESGKNCLKILETFEKILESFEKVLENFVKKFRKFWENFKKFKKFLENSKNYVLFIKI